MLSVLLDFTFAEHSTYIAECDVIFMIALSLT
jgi:hypothetical protein